MANDFFKAIKLPDNTEKWYKRGIYPVIGTQTASTGSWTGVIEVPALYDGLTIAYFLPYAGSGNATLNLTLSNGTTTGAINCYYNSSRLTTHYGAGSNIIMTYHSAGSIKVNGTATTDNRWIAQADYNTNTDTKVTSAANHYAPAEDSSAQLSASASGATAAWSIDVVKGITIKRDAKGHVTGVAVTSGKIPANPNTNTTYTLSSGTNNGTLKLTPSSGSAQDNVKVTGWDDMATKSYVDGLVANATHFCGSFNASNGKINGGSNTLTSVAEKVGDMYTCDTAGTYLSQAYEVGDSIIFKNAVAASTAPVAADIISVEKTVSVTQTLTSGTKIGTVEGVDLYCQTNTDTKVTAVGNHYAPTADSSSALSASASGATAAWSIDVVKGITLKRDAKGHVTGLSVTSGKIPANPNTDTKVTISNTTPTSTTSYYPVWYTATSGTGGLNANDGFKFNYEVLDTTTATAMCGIQLGNNTVGGKAGNLGLYSIDKGIARIIYTFTATSDTIHTLPETNGTILNTGTTSFTQTLTSGTKIGTIKIDNTSTDIYCQTNTDTKVRQTLTSTNAYKPLLMAYSANTVTTTNVDNVSYRNNSIYANPSTGTIYSTAVDTGKVQLANGSLEDGVAGDNKPKLTLNGPGNETLEFHENFAEFKLGTYGGVTIENTKAQLSHSSSVEINSGGGVNITGGTGGATINSGSGTLSLQANTTNGSIILTGADTQIKTSQIHMGTTSSTTAINIGNNAATISQTGKSVTISAVSSTATNTLTLSASGSTAGNVSIEAGGPSGRLTLKTASAGSINLTAGVTGSINITSGTTSGSIKITAKTWTTGSGTAAYINGSGQIVKYSSSLRYKNNIDYDIDKEDYHNQLMSFKPCTYEYNELPYEQNLGLIAEDVYKVNPQLVNYDDNFEIESYRDRDITTILIIEAQEKDKKIKELEDRINQLEYLVNQLTGLSNDNLWN